jgi:hypothetical protein
MASRKWIWRYADLFISIARNPAGPGYQARGILRDGRDAVATFPAPVLEEEIGRVREAMSNPHAGNRDLPAEIGKKLYDAVFSGSVGGLLAVAEARLGWCQGLRIRFRAGSPEVSEWPFELLHGPLGFLALGKEMPIVRYMGKASPLKTLFGLRPLRVLVVVASPKPLGVLDVEQEWREIREALEPLVQKKRVEIERLDAPTFADLGARLRSRKFHVLHFIGHGAFNLAGNKGVIFLHGPNDDAAPITGAALALLLGGHPSMRLVVLNTCEGSLVKEDRFTGIAQALIREGIPAVVAMQAKVPDSSAVLFSRRFYERLAKGEPIDLAVTEARFTLYLEGAAIQSDWAIPVLYMGTKTGWLFRWLPKISTIGMFLLLLVALIYLSVRPPWKPRCPSPKAVDMDLVWIEPTVGSPFSKPFCLGAREVSRGEWEAVMGPNSLPKDQRGKDDLPAGVSYLHAKAFIQKLNDKEKGAVHRLPTDSEWEYAASGPGASKAGNCLRGDEHSGLAPVGTFRTNDWGLYDMVGNVWEWVEGPAAPDGKRLRRGGAWDSAEANCGTGAKKLLTPDNDYQSTGFRILREINAR